MVHRSCFHVLLHPRLQIRGFSFLKTYESRFFPPLPPPPPFLFPRWPNERVLSFEELRFSISRVVFPFLLLRFSVTIQDEDVIRSRERGKKGETNKRESSIFQKIERGKSEGKKKNWFLLLDVKKKKKKKLNRIEEKRRGKYFRELLYFTGRKMHSRGRKMQLVPCFGGVEIVLCLWITSAVLTLVASQQKFYIQGRYGKRQEPRTGEREL